VRHLYGSAAVADPYWPARFGIVISRASDLRGLGDFGEKRDYHLTLKEYTRMERTYANNLWLILRAARPADKRVMWSRIFVKWEARASTHTNSLSKSRATMSKMVLELPAYLTVNGGWV
jgi:hypothetical protein